MESRKLPRYKSHKTVWALKIKDLTEISSEEGDVMITPEEEGYNPIVVDKAYMDKHKPSVGGYYVLYEGGYESFSPAKVFERGYTLEVTEDSSAFIERLRSEQQNLETRYRSLEKVLSDNDFLDTISENQFQLLAAQSAAMLTYNRILTARLTDLGVKF